MSAGLDRERLAAVLGMLGSAHDGEILAAARQAERLRRGAGLTWGDILTPAPPELRSGREIETIAEAIEIALMCEGLLTDWENNFVRSLSSQRSPISEKQRTILNQIVEKLRAISARAA